MQRRIATVITASVLSAGLVFGVTPIAVAAPGHTTAASPSLVATSLSGTANPAPTPPPAPSPSPGATAAEPTPRAIPIAVRVAVRAALETIKRTNVTMYNNIMRYVNQGRTAFVNWWNTSVPGWVKSLFGGISAAAIYDTIRFIIGI